MGELDDHHLVLLRAYEPIIRFTEGEYFLPAPVDAFVASCRLVKRDAQGRAGVVADQGAVTLDDLPDLESDRTARYSLALAQRPLRRRELVAWRLRRDRPRFLGGGTRLAHVGVLSRLLDAFNRASLVIRGSVAAGSEAAAETAYRPELARTTHPYFGRVVRQAGYVVLQYWFFYYFNDWRSRAHGVNDHEGDWEQVTIYLAEQEHGEPVPAWIAFSAHDEVGDDLRRRWDDPDLTLEGTHPVVHAGLGSHSGSYLAGDHLISVEWSAVGSALRWGRRPARLGLRLSRALLPWTRGAETERFGMPYVDYARGDGLAVGPGCERTWSPVLIDDDTPWVRDYVGLWGADTEDPFGGERAPAGPRYERNGRVRDSWGDPVGWAGLEKVPPNEGARRRVVEERIAELDEELRDLDARQVQVRRALRAEVAAGRSAVGDDESTVRLLTATRIKLDDDRRRLQRSLARRSDVGDPHAHLHHRRLPLPGTLDGRERALRLFSVISTPLVIVAIAMMFLPLGPSVIAVGGIGLFVILLMEAIARRRLFAFVVTVVIVTVAAIVVTAIVAGLIAEWRTTVVVVLATAAATVFLLNVAELRRT